VDLIIIYIETDGATKAANLNEIYRIEKKINSELSVKGIDYTISLASLIAETSKRITQQDSVPSQQQAVDLYISQIPDSMKYKLISKDGKDAIMLVSVSRDADQTILFNELNGVISQANGVEMHSTGPVAMAQEAVSWTMENMIPITVLSLTSVCAVLLLFHRNLKIVLIAGAPVVYSIAFTSGILGFLNVKFTPNVIAVGCVLIAMGIAYGLYMTNQYAEELHKMGAEDAIKRTISTTGKAIMLSAVTTMVGFAALMTAPMPPIFAMGLALTIGIFFCYAATMLVVPCLILILKYEKRGKNPEWTRLAKFTQHPKKIAIAIAAVTVLSLLCVPYVSMEVDLVNMAPQGIASVDRIKVYSEKFEAGQPSFFAVSGDMLDPNVLRSMDSLQQKINTVDGVSCYSIVDVLKKLNGGSAPQTRQQSQLIVNTMLGEKERRMLLADGTGRAIVFVDMPMTPLAETERMVSGVRNVMAANPLSGCQSTELTGIGPILMSIHNSMMKSQVSSAIAAFFAVFVCMLPVFRSFNYSLLTMVPLTITLLWEPMVLVGLGVPLTVITVTISSIVIGVGVDFAIQITQRVIDERKAGAGGLEAVFEAITKMGPSLFEATATIIAGLVPVLILDYQTMREFIIVDILMLSCACATAVLILPALYSIRYGKWIESWTAIELRLAVPNGLSQMASDASERARAYVSTHISKLHIRSLSQWLESRRNR
jgi:hydrophobe/amphiphile efflux-3 (HAE3) family protein